jgi:hypothetical protein
MLLNILVFYYALINSNQVSPVNIRDYITTEALVIGVDPQIALGVAKAESGFDPENIGDNNTSFGVWQIHLPAHQEISKEQANDIIFSTTWALQEMKANGCRIWSTCKDTMKKINQNSS